MALLVPGKTKKILSEFKRTGDNVLSESISTEDHRRIWKQQKESIASKPTNLLFLHFKAAANDLMLVDLDATFRSLPYKYGFSLLLWQGITDVQILKKSSVFQINKMRTSMLMNREFNTNNKWIGKTVMQRGEENKGLAREQYSSCKGKQAIVVALNK